MGNKLRTFTEGEFEIFENICRMSQKQLHKGLKDIFSDMYGKQNVINKEKYLYIQGTTPVLLVAHLDTVFKTPNRGIYFDPEKNVIWGGAISCFECVFTEMAAPIYFTNLATFNATWRHWLYDTRFERVRRTIRYYYI